MSTLAPFATVLFAVTVSAQIATTDVSGHTVQLFDTGASKPTVLIFVRVDCPVSNRYAPEIERLYQVYSSRAAYHLVYPDAAESSLEIQKHLTDYKLTISALRDPNHVLVKLAKAHVTPEAAVFSTRGELLYHGRIDNRYVSFGKAMNQPTRRDLEQALKEVLAGQPIQEASTPAIGCSLADIK